MLERHTQVDAILGALEMEKEAFQKAQLFAWIFFPIWIIMAIVQAVCFVLSNGQFHPLAKILEDCDVSDEGKYFLIVKVQLNCIREKRLHKHANTKQYTSELRAKPCFFISELLFLNLKYLLLKRFQGM